jgi:hypothetical protein
MNSYIVSIGGLKQTLRKVYNVQNPKGRKDISRLVDAVVMTMLSAKASEC